MSRSREIRDAIREIAGSSGGRVFLVGTVKTVTADTCSVDIDGMELTDVRLTAVNNGVDGKMLLTPRMGSKVLVADMSGGAMRDLAAIGYSEVEKIEATCEKIELNGGKNGGLVNIEELKKWMQNVEGDMQTLQALLQSSPVAGNGAPAAIVFNPRTKSVPQNIEDIKITH